MHRNTVVLAEDNDELRQSISELLADHYEVLAAIGDGKQLVQQATALNPDLLVIDISMPGLSGLEALLQIKDQGVTAKAIILSMSAETAYVRRAFQIGATGFVLKEEAAEDLPRAAAAVLAGGTFVSKRIKFNGQ